MAVAPVYNLTMLDQLADHAATFALTQIHDIIGDTENGNPLQEIIDRTKARFVVEYPAGNENSPVLKVVQLFSGVTFPDQIQVGRVRDNNQDPLDKNSPTVACVTIWLKEHVVLRLSTIIPSAAMDRDPCLIPLADTLTQSLYSVLPQMTHGGNPGNIHEFVREDIQVRMRALHADHPILVRRGPKLQKCVGWKVENGHGRVTGTDMFPRNWDNRTFQAGEKYFLRLILARKNQCPRFVLWVGRTVIIQREGPAIMISPPEPQEIRRYYEAIRRRQ